MEKSRSSIDSCFKWDLTKVYGNLSEFHADIDKVYKIIPEFKKYETALIDENSLYELLKLSLDTNRIIDKLSVYSSMLCDEDTGVNKNRELMEEVSILSNEYEKATYFIDINILKLDYDTICSFYQKNDKLREYEILLKELFRFKDYTLSDNEEKLLSKMSKAFGNNYDTYELLKDSDLSFPSFYVDDKEYSLNNSIYSLYIESDNRELRKKAFEEFYGVYKQYKNVFGNLITSYVKENAVSANIRNYKSSLEKSLYKDELDLSVYNNLIMVVNDRLPVVHRYYAMKKKILNLSQLHLYDVYANMISDDSFTYSFDKAKETVLNALSIFGKEYIGILKQGIEDKWIDAYPNKGKRTGAYSSGSYDTYPYVLLNYQDKYEDMSTIAHELGHSMHSYYTRHNNPYQYGYYAIFVAEVASTVNELLLAKYVIKNSTNKKEKLFIMNRMMELFRATIFRQTMFSEFEKTMYDNVENNKPLTADILSDIYYDLNKKYFGESVCLDDEIRYEWERIPHFYYNFYVYKYATGLSAACYIVNGILNGEVKVDDYISFLKCGKSKNPLDSLKIAGVNLSDKKVIESAIDMFDETMNEFENIYYSE